MSRSKRQYFAPIGNIVYLPLLQEIWYHSAHTPLHMSSGSAPSHVFVSKGVPEMVTYHKLSESGHVSQNSRGVRRIEAFCVETRARKTEQSLVFKVQGLGFRV